MACNELKKEFTRKRCRFMDCLEPCFSSSMWFKNPLPLLTYRLVTLLSHLGVLLYSFISRPYVTGGTVRHFILSFFTIWTFTILVVHFGFASLSSIMRVLHDRWGMASRTRSLDLDENPIGSPSQSPPLTEKDSLIQNDCDVDCLPWYNKAHWILYNILVYNAVLVTLIYWGILYPAIRSQGFQTNAVDIIVHGTNSLFVFIEVLLNAIPTRLLHLFYPVLYAMAYLIFSTIYWAIDHNNVIYVGIIDWNQPINTVIAIIGILVYFAIGHVLMYLIYWLKVFIRKRCCH